MKHKFFIVCLCLLHFLSYSQQLEIHHIDVGQGDATLFIIKDRGNNVKSTVLIDGGGPRKGNVVLAYIEGLGIHKIDYLIASHYDSDHAGGLASIIDFAQANPPA